nr:transcription-associated protein 1-like [Parasteatoda tepidariorum]
MVEQIFKNPALRILAHSFLANTATSPIFATMLVEYLLKRMEEMDLYLHQIVNRSMELASSAKEPYNYFLLCRALFRSIGGGSHDLLYQ